MAHENKLVNCENQTADWSDWSGQFNQLVVRRTKDQTKKNQLQKVDNPFVASFEKFLISKTCVVHILTGYLPEFIFSWNREFLSITCNPNMPLQVMSLYDTYTRAKPYALPVTPTEKKPRYHRYDDESDAYYRARDQDQEDLDLDDLHYGNNKQDALEQHLEQLERERHGDDDWDDF
jgi:hypothetical protein